MADSEGTWQFGTDTAADIAASSFGVWSPTSTPDLWADANVSAPAVTFRALKRAALQTAGLADATRTFTFGVKLGSSGLILTGANAAELALGTTRVRRPVEVRCSFDAAVATKIYPRMSLGVGYDATIEVDSLMVLGAVAMRLKTIVINCGGGAPGTTAIELVIPGDVVADAIVDLEAGVNIIDFLTEAGDHSVAAGGVATVSLDPTSNLDQCSMLLLFEEVPA
jgi:hypothetical protein